MFAGCSDWKELAKELMDQLSPDFMVSCLEAVAGGEAHPTGSSANYGLVEWLAAAWNSWGIPKIHQQEFFITLPLPPPDSELPNEVELIRRVTGLSLNDENSPTLGPYVYVNYARPADLTEFDRTHGRKKDAASLLCDSRLIAVARIEQCTRQSKVRALLNHCDCGPGGTPVPGHHPSALVLYPDIHNVIPPSMPVYPDGIGLPGDAPCLGHVCMSSVGGGNPGTPHLPSSVHIYEEDVLTPDLALTPILVQPIGYTQAVGILSHLSGPRIPDTWKRCMAERIGPSTD
ncbi:unnamed protein product [Echinostoma caproni]|uniref:GMC_oxred_C domain-containing protein n=1 Tax=Echinostoma caproni TaxID=27848 RepID=A0A183BAF8_9TREM|nr:unnamed protein product [Echinostoma caproni]